MASKLNLRNYGIYDKKDGKEFFFVVEAPDTDTAVQIYRTITRRPITSEFKIVSEKGNAVEQRLFNFISAQTGYTRLEYSVVGDLIDRARKANKQIQKEVAENREKINRGIKEIEAKNKIKVGYGD